jgi:cyclohexanecarboxylate-CoA ligase
VALEFDLPQHRIDDAEARGLWPNRLITDYLDDAIARHPDKTAIVAHTAASGLTLRKTCLQLARASLRAASRLAAMGVGRGDVISFQLPNRWEFIALYVACTRLGAVCNPLLPVYRARELRYMLAHAESKVLFIPASFRGFDYGPMIDALRGELPRLRHVVVLDRSPSGPAAGMFDGESLDASETAALAQRPRPHPNDLAEILFTSGTTGEPKGVMHTHNTLFSGIREYVRALGLDGGDIVLQSSPIAHQAGLLHGVVMPLMLGGGVVLQDVWDADVAVGLIEAHGATHIHAATPFLADLAESAALDRHDISSLRRFVCAGAPIPRALARRAAERLRIDVMSSFGMTEIGTATSTRRDDPPERIFGTDGGPFHGIELRVVAQADGRPVAAGTEGRLQLRGMSLFVGYLKRPDLGGGIDAEGWFDSGDLARLDAQGYVRITGRTKDLIIRGGQNVPVVEIEEQLFRHPAVSEVAIVGMPDERLGERACAFVVLRPGACLSFDEMVRFLKNAGTATPYLPERLAVIDAMPRTASGKLQKFRLRQIAARMSTGPKAAHKHKAAT